MSKHPYYCDDVHGPFNIHSVGALDLAAGGRLADCGLAVATIGQLNETRDNAILVPTWYSGTSKAILDIYIGDARPLDPNKYFIVTVNQIGGGLSTSAHNYGGAEESFPIIDIVDDVVAQERLLRTHFGIEKLALVFGGSMGGQQAYEWAVRFPEKVARFASLAATPRASGYLLALLGAMRGNLSSAERSSADRLKQHAKTWGAIGWSPAFYSIEKYKALGFADVESFISGFMQEYFAPMEVSALSSMLTKAARADVAHSKSLDGALERITAKSLIMAIDSDMVFPPSDVVAPAEAVPGAKIEVLTSTDGHLALFGADPDFLAQLDTHLTELLADEV